MKLKISVVVPSYNYGKFIDDCLVSLSKQSYNNYEVLICDGGSSDNSLDIINKYVEGDPRFVLVSNEDSGQADAIRKGFANATGDIYCFLNSDDIYLNMDVFQKVVEEFCNHSYISVLSCGGFYINEFGESLNKINYRYHPLDGHHLMKYRTAVLQPGTFWRRDVYLQGKWLPQYNYVFDVIFFYFSYLEFKWRWVDIAVAGYRKHGDNKSMGVKSDRIRELAEFEGMKFGSHSFRKKYLMMVFELIKYIEEFSFFKRFALRSTYLVINGLSYFSIYRLPGI